MSFSPSLVYDFIFLAVFSFAAVKSWQKGFLAGLTELIGAVLGVGIAPGAAARWPRKSTLAFSATPSPPGSSRPSHSRAAILPLRCRGWTSAGIHPCRAGRGSADCRGPAARKDHALLEPLFLPLVQALLFVLLCMIVRWVFALLVRLLRGVNLIPLVGGANRLLGLVLGLVTGAFDCCCWRCCSGSPPASPPARSTG